MEPDDHALVLFQLYRHEDESGVSGDGVVAYGIRFPEPNSSVVLGWVTTQGLTSTAVYDDLDTVERIHGHGGKTELIVMDSIDCWRAS